MKISYRSVVLVLGFILAGCTKNDGKTTNVFVVNKDEIQEILNSDKYDQEIANAAIEQLGLYFDYTPETFEQKARQTIDVMTVDYKQRALDYLPTRIAEMKAKPHSSSFQVDRTSLTLEKIPFGDKVRAKVKVLGMTTYQPVGEEASTARVQFTLNMLIYSAKGIEYQMVGTSSPE